MKPRPPKAFKDLWVWQRGIALTLEIYKITEQAAPHDKSGAVVLLRRSAITIPVSIARGFAMGRARAYIRALFTAYGATQELETELLLAAELGLVSRQAADRTRVSNDEISQTILNMLSAFPLAQELET